MLGASARRLCSAAGPLTSAGYPVRLIDGQPAKAVLLENIHETAVGILKRQGFEVVEVPKALEGQELIDVAGDAHVLGLRSKTTLTEEFFGSVGWHEHRLHSVGCFCIGTNQVDLTAAADKGVAVFNAPFSNTRSVAEKTVGEVIALRRRLFERSMQLHRGVWTKSASGAHEVRGTVLGIVGYGRIGSQTSVLAELLGMEVKFYDPVRCLPLGNATQVASLEELLEQSDVVSLHVPSSESTHNMLNEEALARMRPGSLLINNARGNVVDVDALAAALSSGHIGGAAIDVFPSEPGSNAEEFLSPLMGIDSVILTPHIGGSTEEAQGNIGVEVAEKLVRLVSEGGTQWCVNLPEVQLPPPPRLHEGVRLLHLHRNVPGVLSQINGLMMELGVNVKAQYLQSDTSLGLVVLDIDPFHVATVLGRLEEIEETVFARAIV